MGGGHGRRRVGLVRPSWGGGGVRGRCSGGRAGQVGVGLLHLLNVLIISISQSGYFVKYNLIKKMIHY